MLYYLNSNRFYGLPALRCGHSHQLILSIAPFINLSMKENLDFAKIMNVSREILVHCWSNQQKSISPRPSVCNSPLRLGILCKWLWMPSASGRWIGDGRCKIIQLPFAPCMVLISIQCRIRYNMQRIPVVSCPNLQSYWWFILTYRIWMRAFLIVYSPFHPLEYSAASHYINQCWFIITMI